MERFYSNKRTGSRDQGVATVAGWFSRFAQFVAAAVNRLKPALGKGAGKLEPAYTGCYEFLPARPVLHYASACAFT